MIELIIGFILGAAFIVWAVLWIAFVWSKRKINKVIKEINGY